MPTEDDARSGPNETDPAKRLESGIAWPLPDEHKADCAIALTWTTGVAVAVFAAAAWMLPFARWSEFDNVYFYADVSLVFANMTDPASNHYRTAMHPLFSLIMCPLVQALQFILHIDAATAVRSLLALNGGLQTGLIYLVLRRMELSRADATVFTALACASAATVYWLPVPETFAFGGTTILLMLTIVAHSKTGSLALLVLGNLATMSMTLTNWMAGVYGTLQLSWGRWRRVLLVFVIAGGTLLALGAVSKLTFPSSGYAGDFRRYMQWVRPPSASDVSSFVFHGMVMPEPIFQHRADGGTEVVVNSSGLTRGATPVLLGRALWLGLLGAGLVAALKHAARPALRNVLLATVSSQFFLHVLFADDPFLFAAHFTPLLVLVAAHSLSVRSRSWFVRVVAVTCVGLVGYSNLATFADTRARMEREVLPWLERGLREPEP